VETTATPVTAVTTTTPVTYTLQMLKETRHTLIETTSPHGAGRFIPELLGAVAFFAALLCTFPRVVARGNLMEPPNLRQSHGRD
jgi:hypothetical protein